MLQAKSLYPLLHLIFIGDVEDSANELVKPEYLANKLVKQDVEGLVVKFWRWVVDRQGSEKFESTTT